MEPPPSISDDKLGEILQQQFSDYKNSRQLEVVMPIVTLGNILMTAFQCYSIMIRERSVVVTSFTMQHVGA